MNNISFTSRINFVDRKTFDNFRRGAFVDFRPQCVTEGFDINLDKSKGFVNDKLCMVKADEFFTEGVRTCTAGGLVDSKSGVAIGFHYYDDLANLNSVDKFIKKIFSMVPNPDKALILGSKDLKFSTYSLPIFKKIQEAISSKVANISIFKEHIFPFSETHLHYSLKDDSWTINSMYRPLTDIQEFDVLSEDIMKKCFKEVSISNGDNLYFSA